MLKEAVFEWLVEKVLDKALALLGDPSEVQRVRRLLASGPARAALNRSLRAAYAALEEEHPKLALDTFNEPFFRQVEVLDELALVLVRDPDEATESQRLAELAQAQYRPGYEPALETLIPPAELFLGSFQEAVDDEPDLRPFRDSRALERLHEIAAFFRTAHPRVPYRREIDALLRFYVERFVGRGEAIKAVTEFTAEAEGDYLLIEAEPGMGKTALAARLVHRYEAGTWRPGGDATAERPPLLYVFLRQEGGRHTPGHFLAFLNSQLLDALDFPGGVPTETEALARQFTALWVEAAERARPDRPLTLLVDGLDEIEPDERGCTVADFLPAHLPSHVHVIVTSRPQPKAFDWVPGYHPLKRARAHRLARFGPEEVQELLVQAGDAVPRDDAFIERLVELTRGEPLFLRFLCEDVAAWGAEAEARLEALPPLEGVEDYFREQLKALEARAEGETAREVLGLLCADRGPMSPDELAEALEVPKKQVRDALEPVRRFLLGDERVELMHLEFRRVVSEEWFTPRELESYRERLLAYCARWQEHQSDYALAHYAGHLFDAGRYDELYGLIDKRWMELKYRRTGSHRSFAADVELAFEAARQQGLTGLPRLIQCSLLVATLGTLAMAVPPEVLEAMARLERIQQALDHIRLMLDPKRQSEALRGITGVLAEKGGSGTFALFLDEILAIAREINEPWEQADALEAIVEAVSQTGDTQQALILACEIQLPWKRARALEAVANTLIKMGQTQKGLTVARGIVSGSDEAQVLATIAPLLARIGQAQDTEALTEEALAVSRKTEEPFQKVVAIGAVAQALAAVGQTEKMGGVVQEALAVSRRIEDPLRKVMAIAAVAQALATVGQTEKMGGVVQEALSVSRNIEMPALQAMAISAVARALAQGRQIQEALAVAREIENPWLRAMAQRDIFWVLMQLGQIQEAVAVARGIETPGLRDQALGAAARGLARAGHIQEALTVAREIEDLGGRAKALAEALAQAGQVEQALEAAREIEEPEEKVRILRVVAQALARLGQTLEAAAVVREALTVAREIEEVERKAGALGDVAQALIHLDQTQEAESVVQEATTVALKIEPSWEESWALVAVAQTLGLINQVQEALAVAREIEEPREKGWALEAVTQALTQTGQTYKALAIARSIEEPLAKTWALRTVAQAFAQTGQTDEALTVIREIKELRQQVQALAQIGQIQEALTLAREIENRQERAQALGEVSCALAQASQAQDAAIVLQEALTVAEEIGDPWQQARTLVDVAKSLAQAGQIQDASIVVQKALTLVRVIEELDEKAWALRDVAQALAQIGRIGEALTVAEDIDEEQWPWEKMAVLKAVAQALAQAGQTEKALGVAREIDEPEMEAEALAAVVQTLARAGQTEEALTVAPDIEEFADKAKALGTVAEVLAQTGHTQKALAVTQEAFEETRHKARDTAFHCLGAFAPVLAALDPRLLVDTWHRVREVEAWWR